MNVQVHVLDAERKLYMDTIDAIPDTDETNFYVFPEHGVLFIL